jgi:PAS domain S-box-containing protein
MPGKPKISDDSAELRRRAELRLSGQRTKPARNQPPADNQRQFHELEVHQIELEMQNVELQKARNELEVALENYTDLYDFAPVGYFSVEESGVILEANLTSAALLGLERSRLINRRLPLLVSPTSRPDFLAFLKKVFSAPTNQVCEALLRKENGGTFWASFQATSAVSLKGTRKWCRVAVSDIAVRKQAEELLRQNEAMFSALITQAPIGVYVVDDRMCMHQVNPKALPVFREVHPLIGRDFSEIIHTLWPGRVADQIVERFRHTLKTGAPYQSSNFAERRQDTGMKEVYEWQIQRVTLPAGAHGVVCFFTNITERKRAEAAQRRLEVLAASNRKLEQEIVQRRMAEAALNKSQQDQSRMLAQSRAMQEQLRNLSRQILLAQEEERKRISRELHDVIAQTLTGINLSLAGLKLGARRNTKDLERDIGRTQRLVADSVKVIHQFARELRPAVLDDLGLIPALNTFVKHFQAKTDIRVNLSAVSGVDLVDGVKRTVLYRVAQEALTNIARHAQVSRAYVKIRKLDDTIRMTVKDNGKGFRAERVSYGKKRSRLGMLGMRERVEMVDGKFTIQSAPGKGTTVLVQIPLAEAQGDGKPTDKIR